MSFETQPVNEPVLRPGQSPVQAASNLLLVVMLLMFTVGLFVQNLHFEAGLAFNQWVLILLPALWFLKRYPANWAAFARVKPLPLKYIPTIILLVVCTWCVLVFVEGILLSLLGATGFEPLEKIPPPETFTRFIVYILTIAVSAGVCEEFLFRGAVMPSLERHGVVPALLFSSVLFALMHMSFLSLISTFVLGLMIGLVVIKTGSIWAGVLYHALNNFIAVAYLYYAVATNPGKAAEGNEAFFALALVAIVLISAAGIAGGLLLLNRQSAAKPLSAYRDGWLPRGWLNWATAVIGLLFLFMAVLELLLGFDVNIFP